MATVCSACGEELIGNVNRCWRCGNVLVSAPVAGDTPAVPPNDTKLTEPVPVAYLIPEEPLQPPSVSESSSSETEIQEAGASPGSDEVIVAQPVRTGSPFRETASGVQTSVLDDVVMPSYPDNVLRENLAVASVVVAIMSLLASLVTPWALIPSAVGLGLGVLGFQSERRRTAIVGVVLSIVAIFFGTWKTIDAVQAYYEQYEMEQMDQLMDY